MPPHRSGQAGARSFVIRCASLAICASRGHRLDWHVQQSQPARGPSSRRFLDPEVIARLRGLDLKARMVVEGFLAGLHRSPYKGFSVEFAEHRPYMPGDEPRRVDWQVYARTDRYYVREYEEETNLRAWLLLDASGSMGRTGPGISKLEYASWLAASIAWLLLHQRDSTGLVTFTDRVDQYIPPRSAPTHLSVLLERLEALKPGGDTDLAGTFHQLAERITRRGLVIIFSDLWDSQEAVLAALRHFRHRRHEVLVFHLLSPEERDLSWRQPVLLRDMETGRELPVDPRVVGPEYRRAAGRFFAEYEQRCRAALVDYHAVFTDQPFDRALFAWLAHRRRLY